MAEPHEHFEAALKALNDDYAWNCSRVPDGSPAQRELARGRAHTEQAMRAYYFAPAVEPTRTLIYPADGDNGSKSV